MRRMAELKILNFENIKIPEFRVSSIHTEEERALIASTVKQIGLVQDMVVRPLPDGNFELISGKARLEELHKVGLTEYTFKVLEANDKMALIMNIIENVARGSYDYVSVSKAINQLLKTGSTLAELEKIFPWKKRWISFLAGLQDLPVDVVQGLQEKKITPTHVQVALNLPTPSEVHSGLRTAITHDWDTSTFKIFVENRARQLAHAKETAAAQGVEPEIPPLMPAELIKYKQCLVCGYQKDAAEVNVQLVCGPCVKLTKYITSQLGPPEEAIHTVFAALQAFQGRQPQKVISQEPSKFPGEV